MLRQLGKEVQGVEHVKVFLEVLRVGRVKEDPPFERLVADLLQGDWRPRNVLGQALLGGLVEDANAVIYAEAGMLPGQEVAGEVFVQKFALHQQRDHPMAEDLDHGMQPRERDEKERTFIIEPALQNDCVEMRVPAEHCRDRSSLRCGTTLTSPKVWCAMTMPVRSGLPAASA
jgi:hypothetical protein